MRPWVDRRSLAFVFVVQAFVAGSVVSSGEQPKPDEAVAPQPLIVDSQPVSTGPSDEPSMPSLGVTGAFPQPPKSLTSPFVVHEGSFTWGPDLPSQTVWTGDQAPDETAWKELFDPALAVAPKYSAAPAFTGYVEGMLGAAHDHQEEFEGGTIGGLFDAFANMSLQLHAIVSQCVDAFVDEDDPNLKPHAKEVAEHMVSAAVCTGNVHLLNDTSVMSAPTEAALEAQTPKLTCGS